MQPETIRKLGFGPFATGTAPMVIHAAIYALVLVLFAIQAFQRSPLWTIYRSP